MNAYDKVEAAFLPSGTPECAAVICYENIFFRDHWKTLTDKPWWSRESPSLDERLAWYRDFIARTGLDWLHLPVFYSREERRHLSIWCQPDGVHKINRLTGQSEHLEEYGLIGSSSDDSKPVHPDHAAETPDEVDALVPVVDYFDPAAFLTEGRNDLAARLLEEYDGAIYPYFRVPSPFWGCYELWGFEEMMIRTVTRPELVDYACRRFLTNSIQRVQKASLLGAAAIFIEEAMTDMISPESFRALNLPVLRQLVDEIRGLGMKSIYYYCGNPAGKWSCILDAGADALSFEEGKKGFDIDIEDVVKRIGGERTILGNLDAIGVLQNGTEMELRAEIFRQLKAGRRNKNRFIMSLGSPVTPGTPVERLQLYCDMVHELGKRW